MRNAFVPNQKEAHMHIAITGQSSGKFLFKPMKEQDQKTGVIFHPHIEISVPFKEFPKHYLHTVHGQIYSDTKRTQHLIVSDFSMQAIFQRQEGLFNPEQDGPIHLTKNSPYVFGIRALQRKNKQNPEKDNTTLRLIDSFNGLSDDEVFIEHPALEENQDHSIVGLMRYRTLPDCRTNPFALIQIGNQLCMIEINIMYNDEIPKVDHFFNENYEEFLNDREFRVDIVIKPVNHEILDRMISGARVLQMASSDNSGRIQKMNTSENQRNRKLVEIFRRIDHQHRKKAYAI